MPKNKTRRIRISVMAPVTVEMIVEQSGDDWIPKSIVQTTYLHKMTTRWIGENTDEDTANEIARLADLAKDE